MSFQPLTQPMNLSSIRKRDSVQTILDKWIKYAINENLLEAQSYQAEWDTLKNKRNLPRVRRARRQFRKRLVDRFCGLTSRSVMKIKPGESFSAKISWPTKP